MERVRGVEDDPMAIKPSLLGREKGPGKNPEEEARERFLAVRLSFYRELARLLQMRTDMSLADLIAVLDQTEKYPRSILQSLVKKLREGEASFSVAIRDYVPVRDSVILTLADKRLCPLESALEFLVDIPE